MFASMSRRRLLAGSAAAGFSAGFPSARAGVAPAVLKIATRVIEVNGRAATVSAILGPGGQHGLTLDGPGRFQAEVVNSLDQPSLLHWHGLTPPTDQDGVPMVSQPVIAAGQSYAYDFVNQRTGTHWMHSHVGLQEQSLLAAPLIVRDKQALAADVQEHVVMLHDFTFRDPAEILAELKSGGGGHAAHANMDHSKMAGMAMPAMLNDVTFDAYLANDRTLADPEVVTIAAGGRLRLRVINAAAASNMWINTGALDAELIAVDGNPVQPVRGNLFPIAVAQRADLMIAMPKQGGAFPVLFQPEGTAMRTGLIVASPGAAIAKLAEASDAPAPALSSEFEAGLRALTPLPQAEGLRSEMLHLGGGGADYLWTLNGSSAMHATILTARAGERIEIAMMNMTNMAHPMHLHGHHFQITGVLGRRIAGAMRDTVLVPPMETITIAFDANNPGTWAFHCHHLYHMNSGMMGVMAYVSPA